MKLQFNADAASEFLRLSLYAFDAGLIGQTQLNARLAVLCQLAQHDDGAAQFALKLLGDDFDDQQEFCEEESQEGPSDENARFKSDGPYIDEVDQILAFKIISGPLKAWEFHQADDDFFPSIPHGHYRGRKQPKLDVYLGWIYTRTKQIDRMDRHLIVSLWNDRSFRSFARIAIKYYLDTYPGYTGWTVTDPRILPAIRRGRRFRKRD